MGRLRARSQSLRRTFMEKELIYRAFNFQTFTDDICTRPLHPQHPLLLYYLLTLKNIYIMLKNTELKI